MTHWPSALPTVQVPLEFIVDIVDREVEKQHRRDSPTEEAHLRKTKSIQTARELFDLELRRGAYPSLRRGLQPQQPQPQPQQQQPTASAASSYQTDPASGLFFLVVDENRPRCNVRASQASEVGGTGEENLTVVSPSTGVPLPYPWVGVHGEGESVAVMDAIYARDSSSVEASAAEGGDNLDWGVGTEVGREDPTEGARVDGTDCVGNHKYDQDQDQDQGDSKFTVPYWAIMRVGDVARDPDDDPDPWPLLGVSDRVSGKASRGLWQQQQQQRRRQLHHPPRKTPSRMSSPPNGYSIVIIHVKVSVHHPRGSAVEANKDAVIEGITKVNWACRLGGGGEELAMSRGDTV